MNLADVLLHPNEYDGNSVASPWSWLLPASASLLHVTVFGNFVLLDAMGRGWLLDSWAGRLHGMCASYEEYKHSAASDEEFFRSWFLVDLFESLKTAGLVRQAVQVFGPIVSPGLGGSLSPKNFSIAPLAAYIATSAAEAHLLQKGAHRRAGA